MQPFLKVVLAVFLAHLLGDFPLQTSNMVRGKERGSRAYLVHGGIHFVVLILCVAAFVDVRMLADAWFWVLASLYIAMHLVIDRGKQGLMRTARVGDSASVFVVDQVLHICTILGLAWFLTGRNGPVCDRSSGGYRQPERKFSKQEWSTASWCSVVDI